MLCLLWVIDAVATLSHISETWPDPFVGHVDAALYKSKLSQLGITHAVSITEGSYK